MHKKRIIITVLIIFGAIILRLLYPFISLSLFYVTMPKHELQIKIEDYIDKYNHICNEDNRVKLDYYTDDGKIVRCGIKFCKEITFDDDSIVAFFLILHNDFGYDYFCNKEVNNEITKHYHYLYFQFENIRISYGDEKPLPIELSNERYNIDVTVNGIYKSIVIDPDTIQKFKGRIYVF